MSRKYIDYLNDQLYYWKKKEKDATSKQEKLRCQMAWETFREKIEKECIINCSCNKEKTDE